MMHKPAWFQEGQILVSTAPTCGLTKGGRLLPLVNRQTGQREQVQDPDTGELIDAIDDQLKADMEALRGGGVTSTLRYVKSEEVSMRSAVPIYYDRRFDDAFDEAMKLPKFSSFTEMTIGQMVEAKLLTIRNGHGSPTQSVRVGTVPYIKVSDLRAGLVNINPTNRVPLAVAQKFWRSKSSGLKAWDLICPERTSKNIGDFCMLMPGQEQVVTTKEVIVLRPGAKANFDPFYLMWALTLSIVRDQWRRVIFMQTNREDVGERYFDIRLPVPKDSKHAEEVSEPFRSYYQNLAKARDDLRGYFTKEPDHHFFIGAADEGADGVDEAEGDDEGVGVVL
jgi:type I restriction enzyme M protein